MRVGVVDIGTNSMRLLIEEDGRDVARIARVTGLGVGVDATGRLAQPAVEKTLAVLAEYGRMMDDLGVSRRAAVATSATRDASNRDQLLDRAESALGVRPEVIDGLREGRLAYAGATSSLGRGDFVVSDIGGGSTEFVSASAVVSVDIGSVRLTDRLLPSRPAAPTDLAAARRHLDELFEAVDTPFGELVGVAGTWTSLGALDIARDGSRNTSVHGHSLTASRLEHLVEALSKMTMDETRALAGLDPERAPVILGGALVAEAVIRRLGVDGALISERDTLDGRAAELAAVP